MEKIITENIRVHVFKCDQCGEEISRSIEYENGRYSNPVNSMHDITISHGLFYPKDMFKYKVLLCKECAKKRTEELEKILETFGYQKYDIGF